MKKNDIIKLEITDLTGGGDGVAKAPDGRVVFVPNTAVGDVIEALIIKVKTKYALGKLNKIITPSPDRCDSNCAVSNRCGGCVFRHITYSKECEIKESQVLNSIRRIGGIEHMPNSIIKASNTENYRNKAQYPIGISKEGRVICGFYTKSSHRIVEADDCRLQPDIFSKITAVFCNWATEKAVSVYNEISGQGLLRHLYLRQADATGEIMVVVVINANEIPYYELLIEALKCILGDKLKSLQININTEKTNVVLGNKCKTLYGQNYITDIICGIKIRISALSFYQVNRSMAEVLYKTAMEYAQPQGETVLDLYCGTGAIGLSMARYAKRVVGVEIVKSAIEDAKINAEINGITNSEFLCMDAAKAAEFLNNRKERPDVVILDPPRKGCDEHLLNIVAEDFKPKRIVYISCNDATLARDCALLAPLGYELKELTPVDLFPRTGHVECVSLLVKNK